MMHLDHCQPLTLTFFLCLAEQCLVCVYLCFLNITSSSDTAIWRVSYLNPKVDILSYFSTNTDLVILIRSASNEYQQHTFLWRNKQNIFLTPPLIWSYKQFQNQTTKAPDQTAQMYMLIWVLLHIAFTLNIQTEML